MIRRLPPVATLRAFEAAARHQSFTEAAKELCLTQSAVSRHVRNLEGWFGLPLFNRGHRYVSLTREGEMYRRELTVAFSQINLATRRIVGAHGQDALNVHAYTTFAMEWLIPKLPEFQEMHPEIDVRLTASLQSVDFKRDDMHCAVRTGPVGWSPNVRADKLFEPRLFPVASPKFAEASWPLIEPKDLYHAKLLHSLARPDDWTTWLRAAELPNVDNARGMKFEYSSMAYLAAQQGLGVAIAQDFLVQKHLRLRTLIRLFDVDAKSDRVYYLLSSPRYEGNVSLERFRDWMLTIRKSV